MTYQDVSDGSDRWRILFNRGNAKAALGRYEEALQDYNDAVQLAPEFARWWILFNRGNAKAALKKYEDALQNYDKAVQLARNTPSESLTGMIFFNQANAKTILGNYKEAIRDYDEAIRLATTGVRKNNARFNKGNVLVMSGHFPEARQCYDGSMCEGDSSVARNIKRLEGVLQSIGGAEYKSVPEPGPDGKVRVVVTVTDGSHGDGRDSREFGFDGNTGNTGNYGGMHSVPGGEGYPGYPPFRVEVKTGNRPPQPSGPKAPVGHMNDPSVYLRNGNQSYQQGKYKAAIESYNQCIAAIGGAAVREPYYLRGNVKAADKDYEGAIEDYNSAWEGTIGDLNSYRASKKGSMICEIGSDRPWILCNRGNAKAALKKYAEAIHDYDEAIQFDQLDQTTRLDPSASLIFFNRANAKTILERYKDAIQDYDEAIRVETTGFFKNSFRFNKGNVLVMSGRFSEARQCYDESVREGDSSVACNRQSLEGVLQRIGGVKYEHDTKHGPDGVVSVVVTVNDGSNENDRTPRVFEFNGNVGNTCNFGGNKVFGGERYPEYPPFLVQVKTGNPPPQPDPPKAT